MSAVHVLRVDADHSQYVRVNIGVMFELAIHTHRLLYQP